LGDGCGDHHRHGLDGDTGHVGFVASVRVLWATTANDEEESREEEQDFHDLVRSVV
jgi:hypothetical protein